MLPAHNSISVLALSRRLIGPDAPLIVDVRRAQAIAQTDCRVATARWQPHDQVEVWHADIPLDREIVVYCAHGHQVGQSAAARLQGFGHRARFLVGGIEAFLAAGGPTVSQVSVCKPPRWVTAATANVDTLACYWLLKRFLGESTEVLFVEPDQVLAVADEVKGGVFAFADDAHRGDGDSCAFDVLRAELRLQDPVTGSMCSVIRGVLSPTSATPESAGLALVISGVADDVDERRALDSVMSVFDGVYRHRHQGMITEVVR